MVIKVNEEEINMFADVTLESASAYIKRGFQEDFIELARESKDENFFVAHICMLNLSRHYIIGNENEKLTPKEAFEKACESFPNANEIMIKTLVTQFSIRGEEFGNWAENPKRWETLWEIEK